MATDIFPFQSPVAPIQAPVESLEVAGYMQGLQASRLQPSTAGAIANAVTEGINAFNTSADAAQRRELNSQRIEANQIELDREARLGGSRTDLEASRIAAEQDKLARETKLRQQSDQLMGILRQGDPVAVKQAYLSGQFADVFAADPKLEPYVARVASTQMTQAERDAIIDIRAGRRRAAEIDKNAERYQRDFDKAYSVYQSDPVVNQILSQNPNLTEQHLIRDVDIVPSGRYNYKDGQIVVNPKTRQYEEVSGYTPGAEPIRTYDIISRSTGRVLHSGAEQENINAITKARATAKNAKEVPFRDDPVSAAIRVGGGQQPGISTTRGSQMAPPTQAAQPRPTISDFMRPKQPQGAVSIGQSRQIFAQTPFITRDGSVNPEAVNVTSATLLANFSVGEEKQREALVPKAQKLVNDTIDHALSYLPTVPDETLYSRVQFMHRRDELTRGILEAEFDSLSADQKKRLEEDTKKVNDYVISYNSSSILGHYFKFAPRGELGRIAMEGRTIRSPEDIYMIRNYERVNSRIDAVLNQAVTAANNQRKQAAMSGSTVRAGILAAISKAQ